MHSSTSASPLTTLGPDATSLWQEAPLLFRHNLHLDPRFSREALGAAIQRYPRQDYAIVATGEQGKGNKRIWREGDFGELTGEQVLEAISYGRLWLNLRNSQAVLPELADVLPQIFSEARALGPPYASFGHRMGILVSSPGAQVYYHADLPGQGLLQLHGRKRIYLYPPKPPFITPEGLENIALTQLEVGLRYDPRFDEDAKVFDLEPGQGLFWPLNAPHRIENHDCLNVSMTVEYDTPEIRRRHMVNLGNAILRNHFGYSPRSRKLGGPSFHAKAILQALWRRSGLLRSLRKSVRPVDFKLDPERLGRIIDLA